jgi:hypothetical protein
LIDGKREIFERSLQLREAAASECVGDPLFRCLGLTVDGPLESATLRGEANDAGPTVFGIRFTCEVAVVFELAEQVVDGLLGDLELVGEFGGTLPVEAWMAEKSDMGRTDVVVSGCDDAGEDLFPHRLPGNAHHRTNERAAVLRAA